MSITQRHLFGWKCEKYLHPILEEILDEPLVKTSNRYNTLDFKGAYWRPELKSRPKYDERGKYQDSNTYESWLVPTCKGVELDNGQVIFFYFWEGDNTLWYCSYSQDSFKDVFRAIPPWSHQEHYWIPKEMFVQAQVEIPTVA